MTTNSKLSNESLASFVRKTYLKMKIINAYKNLTRALKIKKSFYNRSRKNSKAVEVLLYLHTTTALEEG